VPVLQIQRRTSQPLPLIHERLRVRYVAFRTARLSRFVPTGKPLAMCLPRLPICIKIKSTHQEQAILMTDNPDPDKLKGPGGLTLRQIHEQVQKSVERDREAQATRNAVAPPKSRWQRWVRYVWGRSGRR
jgi:hypothetical protein